jgi:hypothetical protein
LKLDLDMCPHPRRALHDCLLKCSAAARINVVLGEIALRGGNFRDCLFEGPLFQLAAIQNARLVEMDVGFDEATDDETAIELLLPNISSDPRLDYYDAASRDADVAECVTLPGDARLAQHKIKWRRHLIGRPRPGPDTRLRAPDPARARTPHRSA